MEIYSFFSGLGLLDLGFEEAGFNIAFVNEIDNQALSAYQYARQKTNRTPKYGFSNEDVRLFLSDEKWEKSFPNYSKRDIDNVVGFIGGPPCPDFSIAGKNKGEKGDNGQLTYVYFELICKRRPDFFVFENVKGLYKTKKHRLFYERMKRKMYNEGYSLFDSIENSLLYGVPQYRDRLFLIGLKRERFGKHIHYRIGSSRKYSFDAINKVKWPAVSPFIENGYLEKPNGIIEDITVNYWFEKNQVKTHFNGSDVFSIKNRSKYSSIQEGDTRWKSFKRLHRWRYSPTAAYGNNEVHLHPFLLRRISVAEALAIQSLPDWFVLPKNLSLSSKFKMVGNGVPFLMALGIARELREWISEFIQREKNNSV